MKKILVLLSILVVIALLYLLDNRNKEKKNTSIVPDIQMGVEGINQLKKIQEMQEMREKELNSEEF